MVDVTSVSSLDVGGTSPTNPGRTSVTRTDALGTSPAVTTRFLSSVSGLGLKGGFPAGKTSESRLGLGGTFPLATERSISSVTAAGLGGKFLTAPIIGVISTATLSTSLTLSRDILLTLNSSGQLTSSLTLDRLQLLSLLSTMSGTSSLSMMGIYRLSLLGGLVGSSLQALLVTGADLSTDTAVWVVNLDTTASAQYENYGFNSFFQRGNDYYGVANDGIYKLTGATDAGTPIDALAAFVRSALGVQSVKHVPSVYIGAATDGSLLVRTDVDGVVRYYKARTSSTHLQQHRVDIGRGVRGTYWEFELLNEDGEDFEVADMTLLPVALDRRM